MLSTGGFPCLLITDFMSFRAGFGYDIHPLVEGRALILGGINIPFNKGLDGDSDADVATHAIIDAILGAMGMGDIGSVFGVGKPELMGVASIKLLEQVYLKMQDKQFRLLNIDVTIVAEKPKLSGFAEAMQQQLAAAIHAHELTDVNIKSTTAKRTGPIGTGEAIAAYAVALLEKTSY